MGERAAAAAMVNDGNQARRLLEEALKAVQRSEAAEDETTAESMRYLIDDVQRCIASTTNVDECAKLCSSHAFAHKHQISTSAEGRSYRNALQQRLTEAIQLELEACLLAGSLQPPIPPKKRSAALVSNGALVDGDYMHAGAVRVGMRVMCKGAPGTVTEVTHSKTGKHGHAKVFMSVRGDDQVIRQDVVPASASIELPPKPSQVGRSDHTLMDICSEGFCCLMAEDGTCRNDLRLPADPLGERIRGQYEAGKQVGVTLGFVRGTEQIIEIERLGS